MIPFFYSCCIFSGLYRDADFFKYSPNSGSSSAILAKTLIAFRHEGVRCVMISIYSVSRVTFFLGSIFIFFLYFLGTRS